MNYRARELSFLIKLLALDQCHSTGDGGSL